MHLIVTTGPDGVPALRYNAAHHARALVTSAGGAPCCCDQPGNDCVCDQTPLYNCQDEPEPDTCCSWGTEYTQAVNLDFAIQYLKVGTQSYPFSLTYASSGRLSATRRVVCVDGLPSVTYEVADFSITGRAVSSLGRSVERTITQETWPTQGMGYATFEEYLAAMFLTVGRTCRHGADRLKITADVIRVHLYYEMPELLPDERWGITSASGNELSFSTNTAACQVFLIGRRCDCPNTFEYRFEDGTPYYETAGSDNGGFVYNPTYVWNGQCQCRLTNYSAANQYDLQDNGQGNFAGRVSYNGSYSHVANVQTPCVPDPCAGGPPGAGCSNCGQGGGL